MPVEQFPNPANDSAQIYATVVSLRFSPAFISHTLAYGRLLRRMGYRVRFLLDERYLGCEDFAAIGEVTTTRESAALGIAPQASLAIFMNPAMGNARAARRMRAHRTEVLYVYHEPVPVRKRLKEGWKEILKLLAARHSSLAMLRASSAILVPSRCALEHYRQFFPRYNPNVFVLPLLFDDEPDANALAASQSSRPCFSFLASAIKAHDFDGFVTFAKFAIASASTIQFSIATRTDLTGLLARDPLLRNYCDQGRIRLQHGRALSNAEMNGEFLRSFCVWNVYKVSTQSGVLARAFMAGAPVLAIRIGSFLETVIPGQTGEFVDAANDWGSMLEKAERMRASFPTYFAACRETFLRAFFLESAEDKLAQILNELPKEKQNANCLSQPAVQDRVW